MRRRTSLVAAGTLPLAACGVAEVKTFATLPAAMKAIEGLATGWKSTGTWTLAQMLEHAAQSVEYSLRSYPQVKDTLFTATIGKAAFAFFEARGKMSHSLAEPIPGAPAIDAKAPLDAAITRVLNALREFDAFGGNSLPPHFAYGMLDKAQYTRAHLMHLANHWQEVTRTDKGAS